VQRERERKRKRDAKESQRSSVDDLRIGADSPSSSSPSSS
jgi:hypothetical protein